jgi:hypothetical protein
MTTVIPKFTKNKVFKTVYNPETSKDDKIVEIHSNGNVIYYIKEQLGQGKDGRTYFAECGDDNSTWVIKVQSKYGQIFYHRTQAIQSILKKLNLDKELSSIIKFPEEIQTNGKKYEVVGYQAKQPYIKYDPTGATSEWITALVEIAKLNSKLLEHNIAIWDFGFVGVADLKGGKFRSGLNYMKDPDSEETRWIDYGGNAFCIPDGNTVFQAWQRYEKDYNWQTAKPVLGMLGSTMLKLHFLLHIEYHHRLQEDNLHTRNFIIGIGSMLQTSSEFINMFGGIENRLFKSDICKEIIKDTHQLDWTAPKTWQKIIKILEGML